MNAFDVLKLVFLLIAAALLAGSYFLYRNTSEFVDAAGRAQGRVIELARSRSDNSHTYAPVVRFRTEQGRDVEFRSNVSSNPPSYTVGESVEVLYQHDRPEKAEINSTLSLWFGPIILGGIGSVFLVIAAAFAFVSGKLSGRPAGSDTRLKLNGQAVQTSLQGVERDTRYSRKGRHPYQVVTQWTNPDTGEIHVFRSEHLWYEPTEHIRKDRKITVYIERGNPAKYYMDLGFLPKMAAEG